ncbi:MAG: guanylate kinase [Nitrospiraceae bacterium]|nr:guanylate kinase [Nitrospiraceae bacterium]
MQRRHKGSFFVISAPSGAGKTTLANKITSKEKNLRVSVSYTTRQPRMGEVDGVDYTFVNDSTFRKMVARGEFAEWAEVHGKLYGTSKKKLEGLMRSGFDVILDIDTQGARQIRASFPKGVFIFILPPSMDVLRDRLVKRKRSDAKEDTDIDSRLKRAVEEIKEALGGIMGHAGHNIYDYVIVNDTLSNALKGLEAIITAERLRTGRVDARWIKENFLS